MSNCCIAFIMLCIFFLILYLYLWKIGAFITSNMQTYMKMEQALYEFVSACKWMMAAYWVKVLPVLTRLTSWHTPKGICVSSWKSTIHLLGKCVLNYRVVIYLKICNCNITKMIKVKLYSAVMLWIINITLLKINLLPIETGLFNLVYCIKYAMYSTVWEELQWVR